MKFNKKIHIPLGSIIGVGILTLSLRMADPCGAASTMIFKVIPSLLPCGAPTTLPAPNHRAEIGRRAILGFVSPSSTFVGNQFSILISVDPQKTPINAIDAKIIYPKDMLKLVSKNEAISPFAIRLLEDDAPTSSEIIQLQPSPGVSSTTTIAKFTFLALRPGIATIYFASSSQVLANDGFGTDVLGPTNSATITILSRTDGR